MLKKFVCLAKSAREGGFCIAGKEILADGNVGNWFRPVGSAEEPLPINECRFNILHIVNCEVSEHAPIPTQLENYKLAQQPNWRIISTFPVQYIHTLLDTPSSLWSIDCSSYHGTNDKVPQQNASRSGNSLYFIEIPQAIIKKSDESFEGNQRFKIRLIFNYNDVDYSLIVTDPNLSRLYWNGLQVGESAQIGSSYLTISLAKPLRGYCYKLVAGYVRI